MRRRLSIALTIEYGPADDFIDGLNPELLRYDIQSTVLDAIKRHIPLSSNLRGATRNIAVALE